MSPCQGWFSPSRSSWAELCTCGSAVIEHCTILSLEDQPTKVQASMWRGSIWVCCGVGGRLSVEDQLTMVTHAQVSREQATTSTVIQAFRMQLSMQLKTMNHCTALSLKTSKYSQISASCFRRWFNLCVHIIKDSILSFIFSTILLHNYHELDGALSLRNTTINEIKVVFYFLCWELDNKPTSK